MIINHIEEQGFTQIMENGDMMTVILTPTGLTMEVTTQDQVRARIAMSNDNIVEYGLAIQLLHLRVVTGG